MGLEKIFNSALDHKSTRKPDLTIPFSDSDTINVLYIQGIQDTDQSRKAMICLADNRMSASDVAEEFEQHHLVTTADKYIIDYAKINSMNEHLLAHISSQEYNHVTLQLAIFKKAFMHLIEQEGLTDEDITIYGHSLGGFFAMKLAAELFDEGYAPKVFCSRSNSKFTLVHPSSRSQHTSAISPPPLINKFHEWNGNVVKTLMNKGYPAGHLFVYAAKSDEFIPEKDSQLHALRKRLDFPQNFGHIVTINSSSIWSAGHNTAMQDLKLEQSKLSSSLSFIEEGKTDIPSVLEGFVNTPVKQLEQLAQDQIEKQKQNAAIILQLFNSKPPSPSCSIL